MKTSVRIYQVDAFTTKRLAGNPAGVVPDASTLTTHQMQAIARELNNSETAFILPASSSDHDVWIRFFTPTTEVPICGHATIAANYVRALELGISNATVRQRTGVGVLPVEIVRVGERVEITMTQGTIEFGQVLSEVHKETLLEALGIDAAALDSRCPIQIVSTGSSKVLVGLKDRSTLNSLKPDLSALTKISQKVGSNGYFVFTLNTMDEGVTAEGRMFAPANGVSEDPVTGNAYGPLGAYAVHYRLVECSRDRITFYAKQGEAVGRPGKVRVSVQIERGEPVQVRVSGCAVIAFTTEMEIE